LFALFPLIAAGTKAWPIDREKFLRWGKLVLIAFAVFAPVYAILMFRFLYHFTWEELLKLYPEGASVFFSWRYIYVYTPRWYYSYQLLFAHGQEFIVLYFACTLVLSWFAIRANDRTAIFAVISLLVYSLIASWTQKFIRGGYHLLPLFLIIIGLTAVH